MREIQAISDIDFPQNLVDKLCGKKNKTDDQSASSLLAYCLVVLLCHHDMSPPGYLFGILIFYKSL
jgi:hypothetical protein